VSRAGKIRRRRRGRRTRRALSLTMWRAVIVGQVQQDLARHGRLFALAALVLGQHSEVRDMEIIALGGIVFPQPEKSVRRRLVPDNVTWQMAAEIFADRPMAGRLPDCGNPHPQRYCLCLACVAARVEP
jgi:hypothetical protein